MLASAGELWRSLAQRLLRALGTDFPPERTREVYGELCRCLAEGRMFGA